jgi:uncharacterized protein YkwD
VIQSTAHSRWQLLLLLLAATVLLLLPFGAEVAEARPAHHTGLAARRAARRIARCERHVPRHRNCGKSARLRHARHRRRGAARKNASESPSSTQVAGPAVNPGSAPGADGEACVNTELIPSSANIEQVREATVCLINERREQHGELALVVSDKLNAAAQGHSEDMVARDYFEHTTPSGEEFQTRIIESGYVPRGAAYELGENIDIATLSLCTPAATVTAWMNSPDHRANILNGEFRETGMGVAPAAPAYFAEGEPGATYTQDFGVLAS